MTLCSRLGDSLPIIYISGKVVRAQAGTFIFMFSCLVTGALNSFRKAEAVGIVFVTQ